MSQGDLITRVFHHTMQKHRYKLSSLFGVFLLVIVVAGIAWAAFGGISGCGTGCNPISAFGLR